MYSFAVISSFSVLVPVFIGLFLLKNLSKAAIIIFLYLMAALIFETVGYVYALRSVNNTFLFYYFTIVEFLLVWLYFIQLQDLKFLRKVTFTTGLLFLTFLLVNYFVQWEQVESFNSITRTVESLLIIFYVMAYFYRMLIRPDVPEISKHPPFWFTSAFLFYFGCSLFVFSLGSQLFDFENSDIFYTAWFFYGIINLVQKSLIAVGLLWYLKK